MSLVGDVVDFFFDLVEAVVEVVEDDFHKFDSFIDCPDHHTVEMSLE